eukprot:scaffold26785_cov103-Cylindrotheca_fusiformis.AAC.2
MLSSQTIDIIFSSWDVIKKVPNYQQAFGDRFSEALSTSKLADWFSGPNNPHQTAFVDVIDLVVHLLGPDLEVIRSELTSLGRRHQCDVKDMQQYLNRDYFQLLIDAFVETLLFFLANQADKLAGKIDEESILHPSKTDSVRVAWNDVFTIIRTFMKEGAKLERHIQRQERQRQRQEEHNQLHEGPYMIAEPKLSQSSSTSSLTALAAKTGIHLKKARRRAKNFLRSPPRRTQSEQDKNLNHS